jgi:hypothetical protein
MNNEQVTVIKTEVEPMLDKAKSLVVKDKDTKEQAVGFIKTLKDFKEKIEERFHPTANKQTAYKAYDGALATEKAFYSPIDTAIKLVSDNVKTFERDEALRIQREAQLAEAKRQEEERKERERLEAQAKKAEEKGKTEKAEALREQAETVTIAPTFTPPPQPVKKLIWKARVVNPILACQSIGAGLIPFNLVEFKVSALNDLGKSYDGKAKIAGIEFYQDVNARIA